MTGGLRPLFGSGPICSPARVVRTVRAGISALCRPHQTQCWAGPGPCQLRTAAAGGVIRAAAFTRPGLLLPPPTSVLISRLTHESSVFCEEDTRKQLIVFFKLYKSLNFFLILW